MQKEQKNALSRQLLVLHTCYNSQSFERGQGPSGFKAKEESY